MIVGNFLEDSWYLLFCKFLCDGWELLDLGTVCVTAVTLKVSCVWSLEVLETCLQVVNNAKLFCTIVNVRAPLPNPRHEISNSGRNLFVENQPLKVHIWASYSVFLGRKPRSFFVYFRKFLLLIPRRSTTWPRVLRCRNWIFIIDRILRGGPASFSRILRGGESLSRDGSIWWNPILAENMLDEFCSKCLDKFPPKQQI
jgi:hypothetical protein